MSTSQPKNPASVAERAASQALWRAESRVGMLVRGRYRLDALLGRGGSGATFRAHDVELARNVALKLVIPRDEQAPDMPRFIQEARIASRLRHPHIVEIFDLGIEDELPYLVMELLEGQTLQQTLRVGGPLSPRRTLEIILPILGAMAFAHDQQILHRDLKPDNIILAVSANGRVTPQLLDFGIAKNTDGATLTRSGTVLGTPAYMSPEQALDETLTPASDVWSLGVMLHMMLSNCLPFEADTLTSVLLKVVNTPAQPLLERAPTVPKLLAHTVDQVLRRDPLRRPNDARTLARRLLAAALAEGIPVPHDPEPIGLPEFESWRQELTSASATQETPMPLLGSRLSESSRATAAQDVVKIEASRPAPPVHARGTANRGARIAVVAILALVVLITAFVMNALRSPSASAPPSSSAGKAERASGPVVPPRSPTTVSDAPPAAPVTIEPSPSLAPAPTVAPNNPKLPANIEPPTKSAPSAKPRSRAKRSAQEPPSNSDDIEFENRWR